MSDIEIVSIASKRPFKARLKRKPITRKPRTSKRSKGKIKPKGISKLMKELDAVFSRFIRLSAADKDGIVSCYTCGHRNHWKKMQNGHYVSRFYKATRWDESNCRIQCSMCNMWKRGDLITFRINLVNELGESHVRFLEESRNVINRLDATVLSEKITYYTQAVQNFASQD